MVGAG
jgi:hypothetical protein